MTQICDQYNYIDYQDTLIGLFDSTLEGEVPTVLTSGDPKVNMTVCIQ